MQNLSTAKRVLSSATSSVKSPPHKLARQGPLQSSPLGIEINGNSNKETTANEPSGSNETLPKELLGGDESLREELCLEDEVLAQDLVEADLEEKVHQFLAARG